VPETTVYVCERCFERAMSPLCERCRAIKANAQRAFDSHHAASPDYIHITRDIAEDVTDE
jgi:hypothetical protein